MAVESLLVRQGVASGVPVAVSYGSLTAVSVSESATTEPQEWAFQREVEAALYGNGYSQQTGAVYRLLQRSGVRDRALPLKKACIAQSLVTQAEFDFSLHVPTPLRHETCAASAFTLIPLTGCSHHGALEVWMR